MIEITIPFDPSVGIGPLALAWHGIFTAVGILFGVWVPAMLVRRSGRGIAEDQVYSVATWGVIGGIVGARLFHVVDCWTLCGYATDPIQILAIWNGGIAIVGGIVGGVVAGSVVMIRRRLPLGFGLDVAAPGIGLGMAIGRIGDVINGEHWAATCEGIGVCVEYTHPETLGQGAATDAAWTGPVHLAVGYEMVWGLIGVGLALTLRPLLAGRAPEGRIFLIWVIWYSIGRFFISFLRHDELVAFGLRQAQIVSLAIVVVGIPLLVLLQLWATRRREMPAA
ncbi:MAG TPA: prolipoprotein diacylglyceryl transferase [Candidatus Limnocylindrales bacterium]|nr:prolipoprotein diacylglyceryl transferase [Candidatus Limnocylindrales bacterium]